MGLTTRTLTNRGLTTRTLTTMGLTIRTLTSRALKIGTLTISGVGRGGTGGGRKKNFSALSTSLESKNKGVLGALPWIHH